MDVYKDFGFEKITIKFSDRPEKRAGDDLVWDQAESALIKAVKSAGYNYELNPGDGAFYGPKLEFVLHDAIGRDWQCGTLQVDFVLPERLDANYIGEDGKKHKPVMLHRAVLGSFERFIGILIENYSGRLPNWLNPIQVGIASINDTCINYCKNINEILVDQNFRCKIDTRNEKLNFKIREFTLERIPFILVIGEKEVERKLVTLRIHGEEKQHILKIDELIKKLKNSCRIS